MPPKKLQILLHQSDEISPIELPELSPILSKMAADEGFEKGQISVAILSDPEIREVNRNYLAHDYETDVISFNLSDDDSSLEGELVISVDTARRVSTEIGWRAESEVLLYAIHGMLHILGYEDESPEDRDEMRRLEVQYLKEFQIEGWEKHPTHGEADFGAPEEGND